MIEIVLRNISSLYVFPPVKRHVVIAGNFHVVEF
jgi:hypothetical protein